MRTAMKDSAPVFPSRTSTSAQPMRIQLRRVKGWRMPPNTVKVDRTTKWGNPFVVGKDGTREECVKLFGHLLAGYVCMTTGNVGKQMDYRKMVIRDHAELAGKNLACWCPANAPCHADVLLNLRHDLIKPERD
jgi:hypothetical protein